MIGGVVVALGWKMGFDNLIGGIEVYNLPLAFIVALCVNGCVSLVMPEPEGDRMRGSHGA